MSLDKAIKHGKERENLIMEHKLLIALADHMVAANDVELIGCINS